jgi:spore maturation protein CgeB
MDAQSPMPHPPRLLLLTSAYFLMGELTAACRRAEVPHLLLDLAAREMDADGFAALIREAQSSFRPDAIVTVNHLGVDREGLLYALAGELRLPIVSWFVDNPEFILPLYPQPDPDNVLVLTWDADSLDAVRGFGFRHVGWLPLGADTERFRPGVAGRAEWRARVSFVGNSMLRKTATRLDSARATPALLAAFPALADAFAVWGGRSVRGFVARERPELLPELDGLGVVRRTAWETALVWRATLAYRLCCVLAMEPYDAMVAGDPGWAELLAGRSFRLHPELNYYADLPGFYPLSEVNFNCTSQQMKGAVNQRVFDVPAAGAFLLTDRRAQVERLFEPGREIMLYDGPEDAADKLAFCLADADLRRRVAEAGRARVLAEHTYGHRLRELVAAMRRAFPSLPGGE